MISIRKLQAQKKGSHELLLYKICFQVILKSGCLLRVCGVFLSCVYVGQVKIVHTFICLALMFLRMPVPKCVDFFVDILLTIVSAACIVDLFSSGIREEWNLSFALHPRKIGGRANYQLWWFIWQNDPNTASCRHPLA